MRKFGFAAMMTLPMSLIGMEMEMQDGDFDSKYCQLAMFALVFWWWCWYFLFWQGLSNKTRSECSAYSDDENSNNDDAGSDRFSWNPKGRIFFCKRGDIKLILLLMEMKIESVTTSELEMDFCIWILPGCCVCTRAHAPLSWRPGWWGRILLYGTIDVKRPELWKQNIQWPIDLKTKTLSEVESS